MNNTALRIDTPTPPRKGTRGGAGDHIYTVLREAIVSLELKPGQILDKQVFADRFGVSRRTVFRVIGSTRIPARPRGRSWKTPMFKCEEDRNETGTFKQRKR